MYHHTKNMNCFDSICFLITITGILQNPFNFSISRTNKAKCYIHVFGQSFPP